MFVSEGTIAAVAPAAGHAGIGVVRLSGAEAGEIGLTLAGRTRPWTARRATRVRLATALGSVDAVVTFFAGPASYTGEDVLEVSAHGNPALLASIVETAVAHGARAARRGEFTLRAFLNGKIDLVQAEAVREVVDAVSPAHVRRAGDHLDGTLSRTLHEIAEALRAVETRLEASVDFPEAGYQFIDVAETTARLTACRRDMWRVLGDQRRVEIVREGARVVIAGAPNVGKSSVFNALVGANRAIVTEVPGTTRDLVSERIVVDGELALLVDTAGLRATDDAVESEGIRRAESALAHADLVLLVLDRSRPLGANEGQWLREMASRNALVVVNKIDLAPYWAAQDIERFECCQVAAPSGAGIEVLARMVGEKIRAAAGPAESAVAVNARQRTLVAEAAGHLDRCLAALATSGARHPEELVIADVRSALEALESVTGRRTSDEMLVEIFENFCIGK